MNDLVKNKMREASRKFMEHPLMRDIVLVHARTVKESLHPKKVTSFVQEHHKQLVTVAVFIGFLVFLATVDLTSATQVRVPFYASSCSGAWQNSSAAAGAPDGGDILSDQNSALLGTGVSGDLTCEGFSGTIPSGVAPARAGIRLAMLIGEPTTIVSLPSENPGVLTGDEPVTSDATTSGTVVPSTASEASEPASESASAVEPVPTPEPAIAIPTPEEVVSFFKTVLMPKIALAEGEDVSVTAQEPVPAPVSVEESEPVIPPSEETVAPRDSNTEMVSSDASIAETAANMPESDATTSETSATVEGDAASASPVSEAQSALHAETTDFLQVQYSLDGTKWETAGVINAVNWHDAYIPLERLTDDQLRSLNTMKVRLRSVSNVTIPNMLVDSISLDVFYEDIPELANPPTIVLKDSSLVMDGQDAFTSDETPTFTVVDPGLTVEAAAKLVEESKADVVKDTAGLINDARADKPGKDSAALAPVLETVQGAVQKILEPMMSAVTPEKASAEAPTIVDATILDAFGNETAITVTIETVVVDGVEKQKITIDKPERSFRPGRYTLHIEMRTPQVIIITEQDFTWGVLALNADRSIYKPNDVAYLQMGVLNDQGRTICDADLTLVIKAPSGQTTTLSTQAGTVEQSGVCAGDTFVNLPDYTAHFSGAGEVGVYQMTLLAVTENGPRSIHDQFEVQAAPSFDVQRTGPTRILPTERYPVTLNIVPNQDWSGTLVETVPDSFDITPPLHSTPYDSVSVQNGVKTISWNVDLHQGQKITIGYYFDAPDISPEFYLIGPLRFMQGADEVFHENREWQIASDATCAATTTGNWNTGSNWTGCSGAGGIPATGDNITINSGVTITMNVASPVLGTITVNGTLNTSDGTSRALSSTTLTIGSTGTLTANASTITLSGTTGTPLTLTAGGTFNTGTSTVTLTGNNAAGNTTIPSNISYYNLTINNSAETFVLNGTTTISAAGTLTITNGTLDTTTSNYTLNAGKISLATSAATCVLTANASTINLTATSGLLFSRAANAVFNAGTSTVALTGNGDATFNSGTTTTFYNVTSSGTGTKTLGLALTLSAAGTLSITNGTFSTGASNLALSVGHIDVQAGGTLTLNTSTMTLTTTDGDPVLSTAGTFSNTAFTITYTGINASGDTIIASGIPYYNLTLNGSGEVYVLEGPTTVSDAGTLTVSAGTLNTTTSNYALSAGKISAANTAVAILTFNGSTVSLTATSGTVFPKSSGAVFNAGTSTVDLTGNGDITLTGAATVSFYNLKISGTGTKSMAVATTVTNVLSITAGTLTTTASNYALTIGNLDLQSGGTLTLNASALTLTGTDGDPVDAIAGTINIGTSTIIYNGNNSSGNTIVSKDISYYNLTVNNSAETYELEGDTTVSVSGTLNIANGTFTTTASNYTLSAGKISLANVSTAILTLNGSTVNLTAVSGSLFSRSGGNGVLNAGTSTVVIAADGDQTILAGVAPTFYNMTIASTGTKSLGLALTVSNTLSITSGTLTTVTNLAVTAGTLSIGSAGTFSANASAVTLNGTSGTPLSNAGTFNAGTSTVNYTGNNAGGNTTIDMHVTYYNLTLNNASETFVPEGNFVVSASGTLTVAAGTFDTTGSNYSLSTGKMVIANLASAIVTLNASTVTLTATSGILLTKGGNGVFTAGTSTVILGGDGDATVNSGVVAFYNLTSSGTGTKTISASFSVTNNLVISNGTFSAPISTTLPVGTMDVQSGATLSLTATTVTISGTNDNPFSAAGTVNMGTSTFVFTGNNPSGNTIIHSGVTYYNLTINNSAETYELEGTTTVDTAGTLTITNGTLDTTSNNYQLTFGKLVIASASSAIFNMNGSLIVATSAGTAISKGTLGVMNPGTSEVQLTGAGSTNLNGSFYDLVVAGSGTKNTGASGATVNHDLTIASGIWNGTTSTITGSGTNTVHVQSGGVLQIGASFFSSVIISFETRDMQAGSTVEYLGGTQTVDSTITYAGLKITTIGTKSLNGPTTATETVNINTNATLTTTASNYALNAGSITIDGTATLTANASTITVTDNWDNAGTFTAGTSTVLFNGPNLSTITGTTSFYNLTISDTSGKEVNFATAGTPIFHVTNAFIALGASGQRLKLYSDSVGTKWQFHPTGTTSASYVDVRDGGCQAGSTTTTPSNSISSGNNDSCWSFAQTLTFALSTNSIGFGTLSSSSARYCTDDGLGSSSETEAHTFSVATTASSGYTVTVKGDTLKSGVNSIAAIGGTNTASSPGTAQFGLRMVASGGLGSVLSPYASSGFAYGATASTPDAVASASSGDGVTTTYSVRYLGNISSVTPAGNYSANITYVVTANY